jgi:hypothetical protein
LDFNAWRPNGTLLGRAAEESVTRLLEVIAPFWIATTGPEPTARFREVTSVIISAQARIGGEAVRNAFRGSHCIG